MTGKIFELWAERFNAGMRGEGRRVLLMLDHVSSHRQHIQLSHVTIKMLPPNTTTHLQPQDAGVIETFKTKIAALRDAHMVEKVDALLARAAAQRRHNAVDEVEQLHHSDVLEAMRWAEES